MAHMNGTTILENRDIKGDFVLSNRMYCVWGYHPEDGLSVDVYEDALRDNLIAMEHNIQGEGASSLVLKGFIEGMIDEF